MQAIIIGKENFMNSSEIIIGVQLAAATYGGNYGKQNQIRKTTSLSKIKKRA